MRFAAVLLLAAAAACGNGAHSSPSADATGPVGWRVVEPADAEAFAVDDVVAVSEILDWNGQVLVLAAAQATNGESSYVAMRSADGETWDRVALLPPVVDDHGTPLSCEIFGGVATRGSRLVLVCKVAGESAADSGLVVATSEDLQRWQLHPVSGTGPLFSVAAAGARDGTVVVYALEADDPNTTEASRLRVWTSSDLDTWVEIPGATPDVMVNGQVTRMRVIDQTIVLVGSQADYSEDHAIATRPALWASVDGAPFQLELLPTLPPSVAERDLGNASDVAGSARRLIVVGTTSVDTTLVPGAWTGSLVDGFEPSTVLPPPADEPTSGHLWSVAMADDGTPVAVGSLQRGSSGHTWTSTDNGAEWTSTGAGPSNAGMWDENVVGTSLEPLRFWILRGSS